jgi:hypothetical protein
MENVGVIWGGGGVTEGIKQERLRHFLKVSQEVKEKWEGPD